MCERLLQFLLAESSSGVMEKLSFQLMEALLYRVQLSLFTGRLESALAVLQVRCDLRHLLHADGCHCFTTAPQTQRQSGRNIFYRV